MAQVNTYVHAVDPETHQVVVLKPGDEVPQSLAGVVTNPAVLGVDAPESGDEGDESEGDDDYEHRNVTELRTELETRGLDTSGKKDVLVARLRESDAGQ